MSPNDPDWKKELSRPPQEGKGFDEKLRRRIEEQLDRKEDRRRKRYWFWPVLGSFCAAALTLAGIGAAPILLDVWSDKSSSHAAAAPAEEIVMTASAQRASVAPVSIKTGVLIGLRQDHPAAVPTAGAAQETSSYRTLMIAPVDGEVRVAAEGNGILVPYGQKFWRIDAETYSSPTDSIHYLNAHPADKNAEHAAIKDNPEEEVRYSEKLVFAGNQYVSIAEQKAVAASGSTAPAALFNRVRVDKLNRMTAAAADIFVGGGNEEHVTVMDIFGEGALGILSGITRSDGTAVLAKALTGSSWSITRKPGRWTAQVAEMVTGTGNTIVDYRLQDYPSMLPETVTAHDSVSLTWGQVRMLQPDAKDLLSSPLEDMNIVLTDRELVVHPAAAADRPTTSLLTVPLKPGEKLVSAQWATGSYVPAWVEKSQKYLGSPRTE